MAKRRKKKNSLKTNLKYEVYGILFIIFSVITLAGQGTIPGIGSVGRSLSSLCLFLTGQIHFVIPVIFIYIGLFVMIKRKWPKQWSYRKTGVLLGIVAVLITFHINLFSDLYPLDNYETKLIFSQSYEYIKDVIFSSDPALTNINLGGGMVGAILYGTLHFFFGNTGSIILVIAIFLISFICITGMSYVDLGAKFRNQLKIFIGLLQERWLEFVDRLKQKRRSSILTDSNDALDEENYHSYTEEKSKKKPKPLLLQLLQSKEDAEESRNELSDAVIPMTSEKESDSVIEVEAVMNSKIPLFRDFQAQIGQNQTMNSSLNDPELDPDEVIIKPKDDMDNTSNDTESKSVDESFPVRVVPYQLPPFNLLSRPEVTKGGGDTDYKANARKLEATLESFGVRTKVLEVVRGPSVTRYEIQPDIGVKVSRIVSLTDDIALALAAKDIRMEAPIPGKSAIGIEVPNTEVSIVTMREVMESSAFMKSDSKLSITLGRDISGQPIIGNLAKMPHLLVAGATGSGKSVCVNGIIVSILYKAKPNEVKFLMIDPKKVELNVYNGIPHLLAPVVTDPRRASLALKKVVSEMEKRYELFSNSGARNIEGYNEIINLSKEVEPLPYIVVIVDELADLMMVAAKDVEDAICRLAQMARAAGIHLIIATQRPSVDVITGLIKANIPSRIAFGVSSQVDSRTILDSVGAEKLLGRGDMLFLPVGASKSIRVQGAFLSDHEVESVVTFVKNQAKAEYQEEMVPEVEEQSAIAIEQEDELYDQAVQIIVEAKQASVSLLQRRMRVGYTRAARLIDSMEANGVVGPYEGSKPREVLITMEQFHESRKSS